MNCKRWCSGSSLCYEVTITKKQWCLLGRLTTGCDILQQGCTTVQNDGPHVISSEVSGRGQKVHCATLLRMITDSTINYQHRILYSLFIT